MYVPYGPYIGCVDGALEKVMELLDWALSYGLTVLIDVHTAYVGWIFVDARTHKSVQQRISEWV